MPEPFEQLAGAIHEAAFHPPAWVDALAQVSEFCGARVGNLIAVDETNRVTVNWLSNLSADIAAELGDRAGDPTENPRVRAALNRPLLVPFTDDEILSAGERERHSLYQLFDHGDTGFASNIVLYRQPGFFAGVGFGSRHFGRDGCPHHHDRLAECGKVIRQALRVQVALEHRGTEALKAGLEAMRAAAFLCKADGRVLEVTRQGEMLLQEGRRLRLRQGRLEATAPGYATSLQDAIAAGSVDLRQSSRTLMITDADGVDALTLDITRLPHAHSLGFSPSVLVIARATSGRTETGAAAAKRVFGLTEAEVEVAIALTRGDAPEEIARDRRVSVDTIRTQIRALYSKTGVTRATKLARLIEGLD